MFHLIIKMYWIPLFLGISALFYFCAIRPFTYWSRRGIPQKSLAYQWLNSARFLFRTKSLPDVEVDSFNNFQGNRYCGSYQFLSPVLLLRDPELIKQISVKDFDHFTDHSEIVPDDLDSLWGRLLFFMKGEKWRDMRTTLSPSFTSSKMRAMFKLIDDCVQQFVGNFKKSDTEHKVEMKDAFSRLTTDVIATTAFGITCDSIADRNNQFYVMGKEIMNWGGFWRALSLFAILISPTFSKIFGIKILPSKLADFYRNIVKDTIEIREKKGIVRPDMIHLLIEAQKGRLEHEEHNVTIDTGFAVLKETHIRNDKSHKKPLLTLDDLTAQVLSFFAAGLQSVSDLLCFLSYELAVNPDIQETLRNEIDLTLNKRDGSLTYEDLLSMKYMDMVVSEGLRKWPNAIGIGRTCGKPYTIQPERPDEEPLHIEKGTVLWLPIYAIHRCAEFYSDPDRFDPERFNEENKGSIKAGTYIPFGVGPRSCIGNRFALLEVKTVMFHILLNFVIEPTEETNIPLKLSKGFAFTSENGFWFNLKPRSA